MLIDGEHHRTIEVAGDGRTVRAIDQRLLPHELAWAELRTFEDAARAIETMLVRGAPLIGATAAYGICLAMLEDASDDALERAYERLIRTRPTAVNLRWALDRMRAPCATGPGSGGASSPTPRRPRSATRTSRSAARSATTGSG